MEIYKLRRFSNIVKENAVHASEKQDQKLG